MKNTKKRIGFFLVFLLLFGVEIIIGRFFHDKFVRPYLGDVIVVILIYCFIRAVFPNGIRLLPLWVFLFSVVVEILQYFHYVDIIGLGDIPLARIVMGTSFSFIDIICYFSGCVICYLYEVIFEKRP